MQTNTSSFLTYIKNKQKDCLDTTGLPGRESSPLNLTNGCRKNNFCEFFFLFFSGRGTRDSYEMRRIHFSYFVGILFVLHALSFVSSSLPPPPPLTREDVASRAFPMIEKGRIVQYIFKSSFEGDVTALKECLKAIKTLGLTRLGWKQEEMKERMSEVLGTKGKDGYTALHFAIIAAYRQLESSPPLPSSSSASLLSPSSSSSHNQVIELLLRTNAPRITKDVLCPLHFAVSYRNSHAVELLLAKTDSNHYCLHQRDIYNQTVLHVATRSKASGLARFFLKHFPSSSSSSSSSSSASFSSSSSSSFPDNSFDSPSNILASLSSTSLSSVPSQNQVLELLKVSIPSQQVAEEYGFVELTNSISDWDVRFLVSSGARIDSEDNRRMTPLLLATEAGRERTVRFLLEELERASYPSPSSSPSSQSSGSTYSTSSSSSSLASLLMKGGQWNQTAFHIAAIYNHCSILKLLIKTLQTSSSSPSSSATSLLDEFKDQYGRTPLMLAFLHSSSCSVSLLLEEGSNPLLTDNQGLNSLEHALRGEPRGEGHLSSSSSPSSTPTPSSLGNGGWDQYLSLDSVALSLKEEREEREKEEKEEQKSHLRELREGLLPKCDIERRKAEELTREEFLRDYLRVSRPVIIEGLLNSWKAWESWKKESLIETHGRKRFSVAGTIISYRFPSRRLFFSLSFFVLLTSQLSLLFYFSLLSFSLSSLISLLIIGIPYGNLYGMQEAEMSLSEFIDSWKPDQSRKEQQFPLYIFDGGILNRVKEMAKDFEVPSLFSNFSVVLTQWMLGPALRYLLLLDLSCLVSSSFIL
jgi:ankyrin repeat protein